MSNRATTSRPIRQSSYVIKQAKVVRNSIAKHGNPGVTSEFLAWLNKQLHNQGQQTIKV